MTDDNDYTVRDDTKPAVIAIADLVHRTGASDFEIGYLWDEGEPEYAERGPEWWAAARYRGTRILAEKHPFPSHASDHLACLILDGGHCTHCGRTCVATSTPTGSYIATRGGECVWRREGDVWLSGCGATPSTRGPNREKRRGHPTHRRRHR